MRDPWEKFDAGKKFAQLAAADAIERLERELAEARLDLESAKNTISVKNEQYGTADMWMKHYKKELVKARKEVEDWKQSVANKQEAVVQAQDALIEARKDTERALAYIASEHAANPSGYSYDPKGCSCDWCERAAYDAGEEK
jgi:chromosome segregation ATPase